MKHELPVVTLSNGKRVANFSSPHAFTFEDGTVLPACTPECAEDMKVEFNETLQMICIDPPSDVITLDFTLSEDVWERINLCFSAFAEDTLDVVFCPLPMIKAMIKEKDLDWVLHSPFRAIRMEDRIKKLVSITKECL